MIRAIVFDFDGLILDTEEPILRAWQEVYAEHGCEVPMDLWAQTLGTTDHWFDPHAHLEKLTGLVLDAEAHRARTGVRHREIIAGLEALPGVSAWISEARASGLRLGVASSSSRAWVTGHLGRLGLLESFGAIRCRDDVARTKPDPALYLAVLADLGVTGEEAIAIEDSPNGLAAARAAGMYTVAVPNMLTAVLDLSSAHVRLDSLADISLTEAVCRVTFGGGL